MAQEMTQHRVTQEQRQWAHWQVRVPCPLDAAATELMHVGRIASRSILVRSVLDRLQVWYVAGYYPRMPLDWDMERLRTARIPEGGMDATTLATLLAACRRSWPYDMTDRVRWKLTIPPDLDAFADRVIRDGYYSSSSDLVAHAVAWRVRGVSLGYPVRLPIEYSPEQAISPANRVPPRLLSE